MFPEWRSQVVNRVTGAQQTKCFPPPLPKDKAEVIPFLKQYLLYVVKRLCHSWHFQKFLHICMCTLSAVFLCALCIIANDNARRRTIEEKYVLLRDFSRLDDRTSQRADYIEWLYSDENEHRQEIDELWQQRQQRLINKKPRWVQKCHSWIWKLPLWGLSEKEMQTTEQYRFNCLHTFIL